MTFYEFLDEVEERLKLFLPSEYQDIKLEMREISKLNDRYTGLVVSKDEAGMSPIFNMEDMYQKYLAGSDTTEVYHFMADQIMKEFSGIDLQQFQNYDQVRDKLFIRVSNAKTNEEVLKNVPHSIKGDLAITYHLLIDVKDREIGSAMITNQILDQLGVTKDQLHVDAMENSPKILPARIEPLVYVISRILEPDHEQPVTPHGFDEQLKQITLGDGDMVVLSNEELVNGAAAIFYPGVLEQIGEQVGGNFFILPSSTHETILVPDNGSLQLKDLELMVRDINRTEVASKDFLTDTVYHYDTQERKLEIAQTYEDRKAMKEQTAEKPQERISVKAQLKEAEKVCEQQVPKPKGKAKETMIE